MKIEIVDFKYILSIVYNCLVNGFKKNIFKLNFYFYLNLMFGCFNLKEKQCKFYSIYFFGFNY